MSTISVSYQNQNYLSKHTTNHRNFGAEIKTRVTVAQSSFRSKAKMTKFSPNILTTFYWFSDTLLCTLQHIKNLAHTFFVSARYCRFSLSTWSKMKNFDPDHKSKIIHFLYINNFAFIFWVKIFPFWSRWKWKSGISCRKRKSMRLIFHMLQSIWKCIIKSLKTWWNVGGKVSHYCLELKTWFGYWDSCFNLSSKISVVACKFW